MDVLALNNDGAITEDNATESFNLKEKVTGQTDKDATKMLR